jgi:hypothetical protein
MMRLERQEHELLIQVARGSLDLTRIQRVSKLLECQLDWKYLLASAHQHSVVQLLYHRLNAVCPEAVPAPAMSQLRTRYEENTRQNLLLTGELFKLLSIFQTHGIQAIPFKGPTLAQSAYGDIALRQFNDLDLLVHKRDVPRIKDLLAHLGFQATPKLDDAQQGALLRFDCACNFGNEKNVLFDIHWSIAAPYFSLAFDVDQLWDRLEPISIGNKQLLSLSPEDLLQILCLHGFTHLWERLGWISDVAALIDMRRDLDWPLVMDHANRQGTRRILSLGLKLASDLLEAPIPSDVIRAINTEPVVRELAEHVQQHLFDKEPAASRIFDEPLLHFRMRERKRDRLKSCFHLLLSPRFNDWTILALPNGLFFLYYFLRPLRLAGKYGAKLIRADGG